MHSGSRTASPVTLGVSREDSAQGPCGNMRIPERPSRETSLYKKQRESPDKTRRSQGEEQMRRDRSQHSRPVGNPSRPEAERSMKKNHRICLAYSVRALREYTRELDD